MWGAQGGNSGGQGGYTSGLIDLKKDEQLYLYIGGVGGASPVGAAATIAGGYNGGGITKGQDCCYRVFGTGGGATDIRLTSGTWNDFNSLKSRIMVAAGGGGRFSAQSSGGTISAGGAAGVFLHGQRLFQQKAQAERRAAGDGHGRRPRRGGAALQPEPGKHQRRNRICGKDGRTAVFRVAPL